MDLTPAALRFADRVDLSITTPDDDLAATLLVVAAAIDRIGAGDHSDAACVALVQALGALADETTGHPDADSFTRLVAEVWSAGGSIGDSHVADQLVTTCRRWAGGVIETA